MPASIMGMVLADNPRAETILSHVLEKIDTWLDGIDIPQYTVAQSLFCSFSIFFIFIFNYCYSCEQLEKHEGFQMA